MVAVCWLRAGCCWRAVLVHSLVYYGNPPTSASSPAASSLILSCLLCLDSSATFWTSDSPRPFFLLLFWLVPLLSPCWHLVAVTSSLAVSRSHLSPAVPTFSPKRGNLSRLSRTTTTTYPIFSHSLRSSPLSSNRASLPLRSSHLPESSNSNPVPPRGRRHAGICPPGSERGCISHIRPPLSPCLVSKTQQSLPQPFGVCVQRPARVTRQPLESHRRVV